MELRTHFDMLGWVTSPQFNAVKVHRAGQTDMATLARHLSVLQQHARQSQAIGVATPKLWAGVAFGNEPGI